MKKIILLLCVVTSLLLNSCSKEKETPVAAKTIERIILSPEYLLELKTTDFYVGVRYFKNYTDKDEVTLTVNNTKAVITSETVGPLEGTNLLFRVPGITQAGDYKIKCTVKNDQNLLEKELTIRVVDNFSVNTVWNSLDKTYASSFTSYADRFKVTSTYALRTIANTDTQVQFGSYFTLSPTSQQVEKFFIASLPGSYTLTYNTAGLQQIKVINGEPNADPSFVVAKFYADLTTSYGSFISQTNNSSGKVTVYQNGNYLLTVTETGALVSTVITKV